MVSSLHQPITKMKLDHRCLNKRAINIFELITKCNWNKLKRMLRISLFVNKSCVAKCSGPCSYTCKSTHSALHYACQFCPPLDVIKLLYRMYPQALFEQDCKERYVLHIACKHGCRSSVIEYLLKKNPEAARAKDIKNRTPFLLLFKSYLFRTDQQERRASIDLLDAANALHTIDPAASIGEDHTGHTALEYAIKKELPMEIVKYAQDVFCVENLQSQRSSSFSDHIDGPISSDIIQTNIERFYEMKQYVMPEALRTTLTLIYLQEM